MQGRGRLRLIQEVRRLAIAEVSEDRELKRIARTIRGLMYGERHGEVHEDYREGGKRRGLAITYFMERAYRTGFNLFIIVGNLGSGKSAYAMYATLEFMKRLGVRKVSLDYILDEKLVFTFDELRRYIQRVKWRNRHPALIWDDAGIYGSSYLYFIDKWLTMAISGTMQVSRSRVANLLITVPVPEMLVRVIRLIPERIIVVIRPIDEWISQARGYIVEFTPKKEYVYHIFTDTFVKKLPDGFFEKYMELRDSYVDETLKMYDAALEYHRLLREYRVLAMKQKIISLREKLTEYELKASEEIEVELLPPARD